MGISLKFATWHLNFAKFHKVSKNFRQLEVDVALNFTKFHKRSVVGFSLLVIYRRSSSTPRESSAFSPMARSASQHSALDLFAPHRARAKRLSRAPGEPFYVPTSPRYVARPTLCAPPTASHRGPAPSTSRATRRAPVPARRDGSGIAFLGTTRTPPDPAPPAPPPTGSIHTL